MEEKNEAHEEALKKITQRLVFNLDEYFESFRRPLAISKLLQPQAAKISRSGLDWHTVEGELRAQGVRIVLSHENTKYAYPKGASGTQAELQDQVIDLENTRLGRDE